MKGMPLSYLMLFVSVGVVMSENNGTSVEPTAEKPHVTTQGISTENAPTVVTTENAPTEKTTADQSETTEQPTTTVTIPAPTMAPSEEVGVWVVNDSNSVCVIFAQALELTFSYINSTDANKTGSIYLPANDTKATGHCGNDTNVMTLSFYGDFNLTYTFQKNSSSDNIIYFVKEIELNYKMTKKIFPDIKVEQTSPVNATLFHMSLYKAEVDQAFQCNASQTINFNHKEGDYLANITHKDLKSEAFRDNKSRNFSTTVQRCDDDLEVSNIVPIAVGAALAALVVIVLIAYLIGRRTRKRGYESV